MKLQAAKSIKKSHHEKKNTSLYALPSAEEMQQLNTSNTESILRSNLFNLQINQLLKEVNISYSKYPASKHLHALKEIVMEMQDGQHVTEDCLQMKGLKLHNHIKRKEVIIKFQRPSRIDVIGSYLLKSGMNPHYNIDLAVEMPSDCFVAKDFLNYRYFDKRSLYLGTLARELEQHSDIFESVQFSTFCGDINKPIITIRLKNSDEIKTNSRLPTIRIYLVLKEDIFQYSKLLASRCNIKSSKQVEVEIATPQYNNSIIEDMMMVRNLKDLHSCVADCTAFKEAIILSKVWVVQRDMNDSSDSINGFLMSMILVYLMKKGTINKQMNCGQMFKILMNFLAHQPLNALVMPVNNDGVMPTSQELQMLQNHYDMIFVDSSGRYNLMGRVSLEAYHQTRREAEKTSKLLQKSGLASFRAVFLQKSSFWTSFDNYIWIPSANQFKLNNFAGKINDIDTDAFWRKHITALAAKALTDRVKAIRIWTNSSISWEIDSKPVREGSFCLGLLSNGEKALRVVDKGPPADNIEASKEFRAFWKNKAELRRFKDGAIIESIVWDMPSNDRYRIIEEIIKFIVPIHMPMISPESIKCTVSKVYGVVSEHGLSHLEATTDLWSTFEKMSSVLRSMDSLPLSILNIQPSDARFRYTCLSPPEPNPLAFSKGEIINIKNQSEFVSTVLEPLSVIVQFEKSSCWPSSIEAIRQTITAFCLQIMDGLSLVGIRSEIGKDFVDVFTGGYVFRLMINSGKELAVLSEERSAQYINEKNKLYTRYICEPKHTSLIHALHLSNGMYGPTVRFCNYWVTSHMFEQHLTHETVELLVAYCFTSICTNTPGAVLSGFVSFLKLLFTFDWEGEPLVVDINGTFSDAQIDSISHSFNTLRKESSKKLLCIVTEYNWEDKTMWMNKNPEEVVLAYIISQAKSTFHVLEKWLSGGAKTSNISDRIFTTSLETFDVILKVSPCISVLKKQRVHEATDFHVPFYKNDSKFSKMHKAMVGFNPVKDLFHHLRAKYGKLALFFLAKDQSIIAITWRPLMFLPSSFKLQDADYMLLVGGSANTSVKCLPHIVSILNEMVQESKGLIESCSFQ